MYRSSYTSLGRFKLKIFCLCSDLYVNVHIQFWSPTNRFYSTQIHSTEGYLHSTGLNIRYANHFPHDCWTQTWNIIAPLEFILHLFHHSPAPFISLKPNGSQADLCVIFWGFFVCAEDAEGGVETQCSQCVESILCWGPQMRRQFWLLCCIQPSWRHIVPIQWA